jgi:hypothetical protein
MNFVSPSVHTASAGWKRLAIVLLKKCLEGGDEDSEAIWSDFGDGVNKIDQVPTFLQKICILSPSPKTH